MITLGLFAIGPVFHSLEEWVLHGTTAVLDLPYGIAGIIIDFSIRSSWLRVYIIFLTFWRFNYWRKRASIHLTRLSHVRWPRKAACLAVGLKTKNMKLKALALPSSLSAFLGITEPAIFGVNLRYMKPFVMGLIGEPLVVSSLRSSICKVRAWQ